MPNREERTMQICDIEDNLQNLKALIDTVRFCDTESVSRDSVMITLSLAYRELEELAEKLGYAL
jgi:hypothetical protein